MTSTWLLAILIPQYVPGSLWLEGTQVFIRNPSSFAHVLVAAATLGCYLLLFGRNKRTTNAASEAALLREVDRGDSDNLAA